MQAAKDRFKRFLVAWREKGGSRPLEGWWGEALECWKSLGRMWLVCAGEPSAGESRAGKTGGACVSGGISEGRRTSCDVGLGNGRQAPRSLRWTDRAPRLSSAQHWRGAQPIKTSDPGSQGKFLAKDPGSGHPHCLGGSCDCTSTRAGLP